MPYSRSQQISVKGQTVFSAPMGCSESTDNIEVNEHGEFGSL